MIGFRTEAAKRTREASKLAELIEAADAVVVGAGAGLSTAAGFTYSGERFERHFKEFEERYGYHDMYTGGFHPYETLEEFWAFWSRNVLINRYEKAPGTAYDDLLAVVQDKDYFVLTTNVDHQFQLAGFDKKRLFYTQGDYGLLQCSDPCHAKTYDNEQLVRRMVAEQRDGKVPSELIPSCPVCGKPMTLNLRCDDTFVEDEGWHRAHGRYQDFIRRHSGLRTVFLELGVGYNTPIIIKYPFWQMTAANEKATYVCVNKGQASTHPHLTSQSLCIDGDLAEVLSLVRSARAEKGETKIAG